MSYFSLGIVRKRLPALPAPLLSAAPWLLLIIPAFGLSVLYSVYKAALPPSWYPTGVKSLDEAGTRVSEETLKEEKEFGRKSVGLDEKYTQYDVIVIGGGTVGAVLASRLSEDPKIKVLLLEAGKSDQLQLFSRIPASFGKLFLDDKVDWGYWTEPHESVNGRSLRWPRGRMLGGCSAINAMMCHHCSPSDFDEIASLGFPSFSYKSVLPYFTKSQSNIPSSAWPHAPHESRGLLGPVKVGYSFIGQLSLAFVKACGNLGMSIRDDLNRDGDGKGNPGSSGTLGVSRTTTFISNGSRVSTATSYLTPEVLSRSNLTLAVGATVTRILFSDTMPPRAIGVEFTALDHPYPDVTKLDAPRALFRATAAKEVILSAGSMGSPHILKVSGVGPREELEKVGVQVVAELDGVGKNLKDHLAVGIGYKTKKGSSSHYLTHPVRSLPALIEWLRYKTGPLTSNVAEALAFVRSTDQEFAAKSGLPIANFDNLSSGGIGPDFEIIESPMLFGKHGTVPPPPDSVGTDFFTIGAILLRPKSSGTVRIRSKHVFVKPVIEPCLLSEDHDVKGLVYALKLCQAIAKAEPLASQIEGPHNSEGYPTFPDVSRYNDDELAHWVREHSEILYHPVGTVKLGAKGVDGCLDEQLRVHGVAGLRVCDASIFPEQLSGHPMAPLIAIAEKFADELKKDLS